MLMLLVHGPDSGPWHGLQLPRRKRCQRDLPWYLRNTETRTVLLCDAWVPSVMGKMYSFWSMVLNHLLRTGMGTPRAEALLCVSQRHYVWGRCWLFMFGDLLCLSPASLLYILMAGSWFMAGCLKQSFAFRRARNIASTVGGSQRPGAMWPEEYQSWDKGSVRAAMWWEQTVSRSISFYSHRWLFGGADAKAIQTEDLNGVGAIGSFRKEPERSAKSLGIHWMHYARSSSPSGWKPYGQVVWTAGLDIRSTWFWIPALPLSRCVILSKVLSPRP